MSLLPERLERFLDSVLANRWSRRFVAVVLVAAVYVSPRLEWLPYAGGAGATTQVLALLGVVVLYLELVESDIGSLRRQVESTNVYSHDSELTARITGLLEDANPDALYSVDYSGQNATEMVEKALDEGVDVYLLLKLPQTAVTEGQRAQAVSNLRDFLFNQLFGGDELPAAAIDRLNVRFYWTDGVVRARRVGRSHLFLGWYPRFHDEDGDDYPPTFRRVRDVPVADGAGGVPVVDGSAGDGSAGDGADAVEAAVDDGSAFAVGEAQRLRGHDVPAVEVTRDDPEFHVVDEFFADRLFESLWTSGLSPTDLLSVERTLRAHDALDDGEAFLTAFVEEMPGDPDAKEELLERISPDADGVPPGL